MLGSEQAEAVWTRADVWREVRPWREECERLTGEIQHLHAVESTAAEAQVAEVRSLSGELRSARAEEELAVETAAEETRRLRQDCSFALATAATEAQRALSEVQDGLAAEGAEVAAISRALKQTRAEVAAQESAAVYKGQAADLQEVGAGRLRTKLKEEEQAAGSLRLEFAEECREAASASIFAAEESWAVKNGRKQTSEYELMIDCLRLEHANEHDRSAQQLAEQTKSLESLQMEVADEKYQTINLLDDLHAKLQREEHSASEMEAECLTECDIAMDEASHAASEAREKRQARAASDEEARAASLLRRQLEAESSRVLAFSTELRACEELIASRDSTCIRDAWPPHGAQVCSRCQCAPHKPLPEPSLVPEVACRPEGGLQGPLPDAEYLQAEPQTTEVILLRRRVQELQDIVVSLSSEVADNGSPLRDGHGKCNDNNTVASVALLASSTKLGMGCILPPLPAPRPVFGLSSTRLRPRPESGHNVVRASPDMVGATWVSPHILS